MKSFVRDLQNSPYQNHNKILIHYARLSVNVFIMDLLLLTGNIIAYFQLLKRVLDKFLAYQKILNSDFVVINMKGNNNVY